MVTWEAVEQALFVVASVATSLDVGPVVEQAELAEAEAELPQQGLLELLAVAQARGLFHKGLLENLATRH